MNRNVMRYAAATAGLVASAPAVAGALRWALTGRAPWRGPDAEREAQPVPRVLRELELARLADELQAARGRRSPGTMHRVRATTAAYDGVLIDSCRDLGLTPPRGGVPLSATQRLEVESRLLSAGMRW